jgi:ABC-type Fe3+-siderophore transport system permease subunit
MKKQLALIAVCVAVLAIAPFCGPLGPEDTNHFVFSQLRVPRMLVAAITGATLGATGAAFQALFANPLATPSTTGTTAGAALGALIAFVLFPSTIAASGWGVAVLAFTGALAVALPVSALASRRNARIEDILLAGIALTLASGALTTGLQFQADATATRRAVLWSLGSLSQVGYSGVAGVLPLCAIAIAGVLTQTRSLQTLVAGEERAFSQGVNIPWTRTIVLVFGALGVAACVAWCGPIAFVGLIVPHMVRRTLGPLLRHVMPFSCITGAAFLVACDTIGRLALGGRELPVGVITAAVGAPLLIFLILGKRRM